MKWLVNESSGFIIGWFFVITGSAVIFFLAPLARQAYLTKILSGKGFLTKKDGGVLSSIALSVQAMHLPSAKVRLGKYNIFNCNCKRLD